MTARGAQRARGPAALTQAHAATADADTVVELETAQEREAERRRWRPGFDRLRIEWAGDDRQVLARAYEVANQVIAREYADAFALRDRILLAVRTPVCDAHGTPIRDGDGRVVWETDAGGLVAEHWEALGLKEREGLVLAISVRMLDWQQIQQRFHAAALVKKVMWEERYAHEYEVPEAGAVRDREERAKLMAIDERYRAVYQTLVSRQADAIVDAMDKLSLRLSQTLPNR